MLVNLKIKNVALIDSLDITFDNRLNVISGETGSGKSIMLNAMGFVFGDRLDKTLLREGTDTMRVDAFFEDFDTSVKIFINELTGINVDNELVISREYSDNGKSICKINGESVNTTILKKVCSRLIDIHGQHEHQSLMDNEYQLDILDLFSKGEIEPYLDNLNALIDELQKVNSDLYNLGGNLEQKQNLIDLYTYQINEIDNANIKDGEYEEILQEIKEMKSYEKITEHLQEGYKCLAESAYTTPANDLVQEASKQISLLQEFSEKYIDLSSRLESVAVELDDISKTISEYLSSGNFDTDRLQQLDERADFIKDLFRKYGGDYANLIKYYDDISAKLNNLINSESLHKELLGKQEDLLNKIDKVQSKITTIRTRNSVEFADKIQNEISLLGMPNAEVKIQLSKRAEKYTRKGCDLVEFMFSANLGFECKPLAKIASGGELSRFMLAYKIVVADLDDIGTLIFDEIDTGLSGKMAGVVAECLAKLSRCKQVITISHLPQLASMADTNFRVEKYSDDTTHTRLTQIKDRELYFEIARLMGVGENAQALQVAQESKYKCNEFKNKLK
ncbi:MAG: DNA repair protein RecN [Clostridia bacterium]|nr:DNA repair protein RecN [Clostridia bacterium]